MHTLEWSSTPYHFLATKFGLSCDFLPLCTRWIDCPDSLSTIPWYGLQPKNSFGSYLHSSDVKRGGTTGLFLSKMFGAVVNVNLDTVTNMSGVCILSEPDISQAAWWTQLSWSN